MSLQIPRRVHADLYGTTKGDRVRLADTDLLIELKASWGCSAGSGANARGGGR